MAMHKVSLGKSERDTSNQFVKLKAQGIANPGLVALNDHSMADAFPVSPLTAVQKRIRIPQEEMKPKRV